MIVKHRRIGPDVGAALLLVVVAWVAPPGATAQPLTTHPRILVRDADLARLRSWAVASNPVYQQGLAVLAASAKSDMDQGFVPGLDTGSFWFERYATEMYAELFAFMSLVENDPVVRADYAQRAHTLLMYVIDQAVLGAAPGVPFRDPRFSTNVRGFGYGEAFGLTVDWIYPTLSASDKAKIRTVFLRFIDENIHAATTSNNHPVPEYVENDPVLIANPELVRWSGNNFYLSHMRNIAFMTLCLDAADDPGGVLGSLLTNATGAWLYVNDALTRTDARGGLAPEGFEYGPSALAYAAETLVALRTTGRDDPALYGPQVVMANNPFWDQVVPGFLHSESPVPVVNYAWQGPIYQPSYYGDGDLYTTRFFVTLWATLGQQARLTGDTTRLRALRWMAINMEEGGAAALTTRIWKSLSYSGSGRDAIMYFLLCDPADQTPPDPRPALPLSFFGPGLGRILARTGWDGNARWFTYKLSWNAIDHQHGDGNMFELYRNGEWLTKERTGYGPNIGCSDYHNTLALESDPPAQPPQPGGITEINYLRGSQWAYSGGDPTLVAHSITSEYVYALGDATELYNSQNNGTLGISHASRSIMWLPPDHVVLYDRAASTSANRFKRFWLNFATNPVVTGNLATIATPGGQQAFVTSLLPAGAIITAEPAEPLTYEPAQDEPMAFRLRVEAPGAPPSARFLHVIEGADGGASPASAALVGSSAGTPYHGAAVAGRAVLFPVDVGTPFSGTTYTVPAAIGRHLVTGLVPGAGYDWSATLQSGQLTMTVAPGGARAFADSGGVLVIDPLTCGALAVAPASLPPAALGMAYAQTLTAAGGVAPYSFSSAPLPPGLSLSSAGALSGTPSAAGLFVVTIDVVDAIGCAGRQDYVLLVNPAGCGTVVLVPATLPPGDPGTAYQQQLTAGGGVAPYVFQVALGAPPPGLSLGTSGLVSGTPTTPGTFDFTVVATDAGGCAGLRWYSLVIGSASDQVVGAGLGQPNENRVKIYREDGTPAGVDFLAYGAGHWGVNVAGGALDGAVLPRVLTGPGPGDVLGPQVRGFDGGGQPLAKVNLFAYGTLRFGVNVASGNVDRDAFDEIVTGAGGGAVFGPHVRAFEDDGGAVAAIAKVSFFAYSTLKYGVNVAGGDVDGDGASEILTAPGPGAIFGPQVRGFDYDGVALASLAKVNFNAFATPGYGAFVAAGDADGDGFHEFVGAPGPGPALAATLRGFDYDGQAVAAIAGFDVTPYATHYGARGGTGDVDGDGRADLLAGAGRDPAADSLVRRYALRSGSLAPIAGSFVPFGTATYGVSVTGLALGY